MFEGGGVGIQGVSGGRPRRKRLAPLTGVVLCTGKGVALTHQHENRSDRFLCPISWCKAGLQLRLDEHPAVASPKVQLGSDVGYDGGSHIGFDRTHLLPLTTAFYIQHFVKHSTRDACGHSCLFHAGTLRIALQSPSTVLKKCCSKRIKLGGGRIEPGQQPVDDG